MAVFTIKWNRRDRYYFIMESKKGEVILTSESYDNPGLLTGVFAPFPIINWMMKSSNGSIRLMVNGILYLKEMMVL